MPIDPNTGERLRDEAGNVVLYEGETPEQAEAEAAAMGQPVMDEEAALEELLAQIPMAGEEPPAEEAGEELPEESPIVMPEAGTMAELFEVIFGDSFDAEDPNDAERMTQVEALLSADPVLAEAVAAGEISLTEVALQFYRALNAGTTSEEVL